VLCSVKNHYIVTVIHIHIHTPTHTHYNCSHSSCLLCNEFKCSKDKHNADNTTIERQKTKR